MSNDSAAFAVSTGRGGVGAPVALLLHEPMEGASYLTRFAFVECIGSARFRITSFTIFGLILSLRRSKSRSSKRFENDGKLNLCWGEVFE